MSLLCLICVVLVCGSFTYLNFGQSQADVPVAQSSGLSLSLTQTAPSVPEDSRKELLAAAKAHKVRIKADEIAYVSNQKMTIVRAPIAGIEKYTDAEFAAGAPVVLMIVKSKTKLAVPDGSYVVKVQYPLQADSGKAIFLDRAGTVVAQRDLGRPVLTPPDPDSPDRVDTEVTGLESCDLYRDMFRRRVPIYDASGSILTYSFPCSDCACNHYQRARLRPGETIVPEAFRLQRERPAWNAGRAAGLACMASHPRAPICPTPTPLGGH